MKKDSHKKKGFFSAVSQIFSRQRKERILITVIGGIFFIGCWQLWHEAWKYVPESLYIKDVSEEPYNYTSPSIKPGNILDRNGTVICDFSEYDGIKNFGKYIDNTIYSPILGFMRNGTNTEEGFIENNGEGFIAKYYKVLRDNSGDNLHGMDITLTLDHELQKRVYDIYNEYIGVYNPEISKGSAVVLDAETGEVLASVAFPSYDVTKGDMREYVYLSHSDAMYPGSTFKLVTSVMLLENGDEDVLRSDYPFHVTGNSKDIMDVYGINPMKINYVEALRRSSNVFFARTILQTSDSKRKMSEIVRRIGIGGQIGTPETGYKKFGVDFAYGGLGSVWDLDNDEKNLKGQSVPEVLYQFANTGYGQGYVKLSAVQNAMISAAMINEGKAYIPYMVKSITNCYGEEQNLDEIAEKYGNEPIYDEATKEKTDNRIWGLQNNREYVQFTSAEIARKIYAAMVNNGSNSENDQNYGFYSNSENDDISERIVGAKTGTAQVEVEEDGEMVEHDILWMVSCAEVNGHKYSVVVNAYEAPFNSSNKLRPTVAAIYDAIAECMLGEVKASESLENILKDCGAAVTEELTEEELAVTEETLATSEQGG